MLSVCIGAPRNSQKEAGILCGERYTPSTMVVTFLNLIAHLEEVVSVRGGCGCTQIICEVL